MVPGFKDFRASWFRYPVPLLGFLARPGTSCLKFLVKPRNSCLKQELLGFTKKINLGSSIIEHKILQISAFYPLKRPKQANRELLSYKINNLGGIVMHGGDAGFLFQGGAHQNITPPVGSFPTPYISPPSETL